MPNDGPGADNTVNSAAEGDQRVGVDTLSKQQSETILTPASPAPTPIISPPVVGATDGALPPGFDARKAEFLSEVQVQQKPATVDYNLFRAYNTGIWLLHGTTWLLATLNTMVSTSPYYYDCHKDQKTADEKHVHDLSVEIYNLKKDASSTKKSARGRLEAQIAGKSLELKGAEDDMKLKLHSRFISGYRVPGFNESGTFGWLNIIPEPDYSRSLASYLAMLTTLTAPLIAVQVQKKWVQREQTAQQYVKSLLVISVTARNSRDDTVLDKCREDFVAATTKYNTEA